MPPLPAEITPLLHRWLTLLDQQSIPVHGVYLFGSLALGDWNPAVSDIDAVVVTRGSLSEVAVQSLANLHADLTQDPMATRLEVMYLPQTDIGSRDSTLPPYPCYRDGDFLPASQGDLNAVTWWLLRRRGITLKGPSAQECFPEVPWNSIEHAMTYNLDTYWHHRAEQDGRIRFLHDFWVDFAVTTLCRIMTTLEDHTIVSKEVAITQWQSRLPDRWHPLLKEAVRLRCHPSAPSLYRTPRDRMEDTISFIAWVRSRAWQTHQS